MINNPKTLLEFMQNFKFLTEGDMLEHENFYTNENLLRLFGAEEVCWQFNVGERNQGYLSGFEQFVPNVHYPNGNVSEGMSLSFLLSKSDNRLQVRLDSNFPGSVRLTFEQIENIFGSNWELDQRAISDRAIQTNRIFYKPTHKMGNMPIIFKLNSQPYKKSIAIEFTNDGGMFSINFSIEKSI